MVFLESLSALISSLSPLGRVGLCAGLALLAYMVGAWLVALRRHRADVADVAWGGGFVLVAWVAYFTGVPSDLGLVTNVLVTVWGLRLMVHIARQHAARGEDFRYVAMRQRWGKWTAGILGLQVFGLQGVILAIVASPLIWIHAHPTSISPLIWEWALPLWLLGFAFEAIGDFQMERFRKSPHPKGAICDRGLWALTRHPNYFGELLQWWVIWGICSTVTGGWWLIASPLLLTFLILFVSGVRPVEQAMQQRPGWSEYAARTPCLVPHAITVMVVSGGSWYGVLVLGAAGHGLLAAGLGLVTLLPMAWMSRHLGRWSKAQIPLFVTSATLLGGIQETVWTQAGWITYAYSGSTPPLWILALYPPFSMSLFTSLQAWRLSPRWAFQLGGLGACAAYWTGGVLGAASLTWAAFPALYLLWGTTFVLLVALKGHLDRIVEPWRDPARMQEPLTVCFDGQCPLCMREMRHLEQRPQTGKVVYLVVDSQRDLDRAGVALSYQTAMEALHATFPSGRTLVGVEALSELYARTSHPGWAVWLAAPVWGSLFSWLYRGWARLRPRR